MQDESDQTKKILKKIMAWMHTPLALIGFAVCGVLFGIFVPNLAKHTEIVGTLYLNYLKLLAIPFLFSALISSIANLVQGRRNMAADISLFKAFRLLCCMAICLGLGTITFGFIANSYLPPTFNMTQLDTLMHKNMDYSKDLNMKIYEIDDSEEVKKPVKKFSIREFVIENLPTNIFQSLYDANALHILVFAILFGLALGVLPPNAAGSSITLFSSIYQTCLELAGWSIHVMPVCTFCLLASAISKVDISMIGLLSRFLAMEFVCVLIFLILGIWIFCRAAKTSLKEMFQVLGRAMLMGFCTCSSLIVLPLVMQNMDKDLGYRKDSLKLLLPLPFSLKMFFPTVAILLTILFVAHIYEAVISFQLIILILLLTPLFVIGVPRIIALTGLLTILGLPNELGIILLIAVETFLEPIGTVFNILYNSLFIPLQIKREPASGDLNSDNTCCNLKEKGKV